jgi:hypothetical protein
MADDDHQKITETVLKLAREQLSVRPEALRVI